LKRILFTLVAILMALVLAAPMASARSENGTAPEVVAQYPGHCAFPV
jgi:hypothetical protein